MNTTKKEDRVRLSVSLPPDLAAKLKQFADFHHVSQGTGVRMALAQFFADMDRKADKIIDEILLEADLRGYTQRRRPNDPEDGVPAHV